MSSTKQVLVDPVDGENKVKMELAQFMEELIDDDYEFKTAKEFTTKTLFEYVEELGKTDNQKAVIMFETPGLDAYINGTDEVENIMYPSLKDTPDFGIRKALSEYVKQNKDNVIYQRDYDKCSDILTKLRGMHDLAWYEAAKRATTAPGPARPISYQSACAAIKRHVRDDPLKRPHHRTIYAALNRDREMEITNRKDQVDLARLRSGYHPKLQSYQNILRPDETDPTCPRCKDGEDTVDHWLQECSAALAAKMKYFGSVKLGHEILAKEPRKAIALPKVTIFGAPADESQ